MKTRILLVVAALAASLDAYAQAPSFGSLNLADATHRHEVRGASTASVTVSGTYSGTVSFEVVSVPGASAVTVDCATPAAPGSAVNSTTGTGVWVCPVAGMSYLQARMSSYSSGAAEIAMTSSQAAGQTVAAGGGGSFDGVLLDAAGGDALTDTVNNALRVNIIAGAGSGGTAMADDTAFTAGTTNVTPAGAMFDDTSPDSVNENDAGVVRMSANRNLYSTIRDAAGNERGVNVNASNQLSVSVDNTMALPTGASSAANQSTAITALQLIDNIPITIGSTTSGQSGALSMGAVTTAAPTYTTAQSHPLSLTTSGQLRVAAESISAGNNNIGDVDIVSVPHTETDDGSVSGSQTAPRVIAQVYGFDGANWVRAGTNSDPCGGGIKVFVAISQTAGAQLLTGTASNRTYVCSFVVSQPSASTQTFSLVSGTGTTCGTGTAAMIGATTAANGMQIPFSAGAGVGSIAKSAANADNVCLLQSGTDRIAGVMSYVVAP